MDTATELSAPADRSGLLKVLEDAGWSLASRGPAGELWASPLGARVGIPNGLTQQDWGWAGVLERVASGMGLAVEEVDSRLRGLWADVFDFRAGTALASEHTIYAASGADLFRSVWQVLRSAATAAQRPQPHITNWSRIGDRVVKHAQFGQTKPGSYILPLIVPLPQTTTAQNAEETQPLPDTQVAIREPEERRVTRTMIDALGQLQTIAIDRARVPDTEAVNELIHRGVTRNLLVSVKNIIEHDDVKSLDVTPKWATEVPVARSLYSVHVDIPSEATDLLDQMIPKFRRSAVQKTEVLSGPIYRMQHKTGEPFGIATVDTRRNGRAASVEIHLRADETLAQAHDWFKHHEIVEARGRVVATNQGLVMRQPDSFRAQGETQLL
ncbi:hypothetical protein AABM36_08510 [Kocuria sp. KSNUG]|uniref:hypothetical protein n=1 Tax=Kocuria sp. KSNUG TaxID=3136676 RepID=UPI003C2DE444